MTALATTSLLRDFVLHLPNETAWEQVKPSDYHQQPATNIHRLQWAAPDVAQYVYSISDRNELFPAVSGMVATMHQAAHAVPIMLTAATAATTLRTQIIESIISTGTADSALWDQLESTYTSQLVEMMAARDPDTAAEYGTAFAHARASETLLKLRYPLTYDDACDIVYNWYITSVYLNYPTT